MVTANPDFSSAVFVQNPTASDYQQVVEWRNTLLSLIDQTSNKSYTRLYKALLHFELNEVEQFLKQV